MLNQPRLAVYLVVRAVEAAAAAVSVVMEL
jgi:hypothetical protein